MTTTITTTVTSTGLATARASSTTEQYSTKEEIESAFKTVKNSFETRKSYDIEWRIHQLEQVEKNGYG